MPLEFEDLAVPFDLLVELVIAQDLVLGDRVVHHVVDRPAREGEDPPQRRPVPIAHLRLGATEATRDAMARLVAENVIAVLDGGPPLTPVV